MTEPASAATRSFLEDLFRRWQASRDLHVWLDALSDDLVWTAAGSASTSGRYEGKQAYQAGVLDKLKQWLKEDPVPVLQRMIVENDWASVLLHATATAQDGSAVEMDYCWQIRVAAGKVKEVIGFYATGPA